MSQQTSTQLPSPPRRRPSRRPYRKRPSPGTTSARSWTSSSPTVKKRGSWIATLSIPVLMAIVLALIYLSNPSTAASQDAQKNAAVYVSQRDGSALVTPDIATAVGRKKATAPHWALQDVKAGVTGAYFAYSAEPATQAVEVCGTDQGTFENGNFDAVVKQLLVVSAQAAVGSPQLTAPASRGVKTDSETFKDGQQTGDFGSAIPLLMFCRSSMTPSFSE